MQHNGRPPISVSDLPLNHVNLRRPEGDRAEGERTMLICGDCGTWVSLRRHMVLPHRRSHRSEAEIRAFAYGRRTAPLERWHRQERCPGSGQRVITDLSYESWRSRLAEAAADAGTRRSARTMVKPTPALPPSLTQMATARREREIAARSARARALIAARTSVSSGEG
ncbi:hypothetical protein [Actinomadura rupiterrae]|uniref:hypothetical protein n=1 Tax=Actinomadura rupiterrae TaxID=559627 RepID=UPI0020A52FD6|nr:hypothetical protein [Actinomadura rupiterrae]MCP2337906.1 hypothetical protein [Actinomadura rupiterrae]